MPKYEVEIREILSMTVTVEAKNPQEAKDLVREQYRRSDYVLNADNFEGVEFRAKRPVRDRNAAR